MSESLRINKNIEKGITDLLEHLLQSKKVKGVFTLRKMNEEGAAAYSLITGVDELNNAVPLHPFMPVNAGNILSTFTLDGPPDETIAAVLRPCELNAFIELVKRAQGSLENLLLISMTCGGVFPLKSLKAGTLKKNLSKYWENVKNGEIDPDIRPTCKSCVDFIPSQADMVVLSTGRKDLEKECSLFLNTKKGRKFAEGAPGSIVTDKMEKEQTEKLKSKREEQREKLFEDFDKNGTGRQAMIKTFSACLGCHACSQICPICYCFLCDFDSKTCEYYPGNVISDLELKGGLKAPPGTLFFHLGRMSHMAVSCVSCGMCSDVCPVNIPVSTVFSRVGHSLQDVFEYRPGEDIEQEIPSGSYKEEEFAEIGEN